MIHGDFIYEQNVEVGINSNVELVSIPFQSLTDKQAKFLELFFQDYQDASQFFTPKLSFNENQLLSNRKKYNSLEEIKDALEQKRKKTISRGTINGFVRKLEKISALNLYPNPNDKKEKSIEISYIGIAYFLQNIHERYYSRTQ
jgi:hypothetical protein